MISRVKRADCDVVEQAEPHETGPFGVVTRRTDSAKRVVAGLTLHDSIHRRHDCTGPTQRSLPRRRRHDGVRIEMAMPFLRNGGENGVDICGFMYKCDVFARGLGCLASHQLPEMIPIKHRVHGA